MLFRSLEIMVRLKPGQGLEQTNAMLRAAQPQILQTGTNQRDPDPLTLAPAATGNSSLRRRFERPLFAMVVAVGLVLLVACANIASLLLARALARRRELSVRLALGSSRWRIARLLFIESLIVAVTGIAGPTGGSPHKPVGLVHFAVASRSGRLIHRERRFGDLGRAEIRRLSVLQALAMLRELAE